MLLQSVQTADTLASVADTTVVEATTTPTEITAITEQLSVLKSMPVDQIIELLATNVVEVVQKAIIAIIILYIGKWGIKHIKSAAIKIMTRRNVDTSLMSFTSSLLGMVLMTLLLITVVSILGIDTTSFVAVFASASLAIGMALSGTLQNFAGGVLILLLKPFKMGDYIEAQGQAGIVKEIQLFNTTINTLDNKVIIIPNGNLSTGIINNFSHEQYRRVDTVFGIKYGDDYDLAKQILTELMEQDDRILKTPERMYFIALSELGASSVDIVTRAWVRSEHYWDVKFEMNEKVYKIFDQRGLTIPFPQMDVHVHNVK